MKFPATLLAVAIATAGLSCASSQVSTSDAQTPGQPISPSGTVTGSAAPKAAANVSSIDGDVPPLDARFHLFCDDVVGPNHIARAGQLKVLLSQTYPGMRGWHIIHTEEKSSLYYGYYRTISKDDPKLDPQEVARAQADLRSINQLKNEQGDKLFRNPTFLLLSDADPAAPPQWNLANAPSDTYWSLQICAYRGEALAGTADRKQCAVDDVRELRAAGIEAYYFHGETISSVCVGAWPRDAVKAQDSAVGKTRRPDATLFVAPDFIPTNIIPPTDKEGNKLVVEAPKLEILDANMAAMVKRFPNHAINGQVFGRPTKNGPPIPDSSFLVLVPHGQNTPIPVAKGNTPVQNTAAANSVDQAANAITGDPGPATPPAQVPGRGRLPSLDQ
jgi:hypothetical protein